MTFNSNEDVVVAMVLNSRTVILNAGDANYVDVGDQFEILSSSAVEVKDPVSGGVLAKIFAPKALVKVVEVLGDHACRAQTFRVIKGHKSVIGLMGGSENRVEYFEYEADDDTQEFQSLKAEPVKRGDKARKIV